MSSQIPWDAAQSSQESLLEMIGPLIHIEAGNTLPNLPGKWQLNWESKCLQGFIPEIRKSMIACNQASNNHKTQSTLSQYLTVHSSALSWEISEMTNIYIHSLLLGNQTPLFQPSLASFKVASRSWTLGIPLHSLEVLCCLGQGGLHPLIKHLHCQPLVMRINNSLYKLQFC